MKNTSGAFSLIEIIIALALITILSVVAVTSYNASQDTAKNAIVTSDLQSLQNTLHSFFSENTTLPQPAGNLKFYNVDGLYEHRYEDEYTFWVSGYFTQDMIPAKYINFTPIDPRNNQFYAYAKTKGYDGFQLAGVIENHFEPRAKVFSNWKWLLSKDHELYVPYLIKEFNWPEFVDSESQRYFPYNPSEKKVIAKIWSFSGTIQVNTTSYTAQSSEVEHITLMQWDSIFTQTGGYMKLYFSDGTYAILWDSSSGSHLELKDMSIVEDYALFTQIRIFLDAGSIWVKSPQFAEKSKFEVTTSDAMAAVRGTIFWVKKTLNATNIVLIEGSIGVNKKSSWDGYEFFTTNDLWSLSTVVDIDNTTQESYIEVKKGESPKGIEVTPPLPTWSLPTSSTGAINTIPDNDIKSDFLDPYIPPSHTLLPLFADMYTLDDALCEVGYIRIDRKCLEEVLFDPDFSDEEKRVFAWYQDVLGRNPDKPWFDYWVGKLWGWGFWTSQSFRTSMPDTLDLDVEHEFKKVGYFHYINEKERYFNPSYKCEAQNSFEVDHMCVENALFKESLDWKLYGYIPFESDLGMRVEGPVVSPYEWWSFDHTGYYPEYIKNRWYFDKLETTFTWAHLDYATQNIPISQVNPQNAIYNWNGNKWVFIGKDNHLKYDISDMPSDNGVAFEVKVRGGFLKHIKSSIYCILDCNILQKNVGASTSELKIGGQIYPKDLSKLSEHWFYTLQVKLEDGDISLRLFGEGIDISETWSGSITVWDDFYIGDQYSQNSQYSQDSQDSQDSLNDLVDEVKIYYKLGTEQGETVQITQ